MIVDVINKETEKPNLVPTYLLDKPNVYKYQTYFSDWIYKNWQHKIFFFLYN